MTDVSIIIVNWNGKEYLLKCLNSLSNSVGYSGEIIVVDNASSDGSAYLIESNYPDVKLLRNEENRGFARASNMGMRRSSGRYLCLVNSDVIVSEDCIQKLVIFMDENQEVGMVGPKVLNVDGTLQPTCKHFPSIWNSLCQALGLNNLFPKSVFFSECCMRYWPHDSIRSVDTLGGCFLMVRRKALDEVDLLDEDFFFYGEDIDWCKRFHKAGWDVVFYPQAEIIHFGGASSKNAPIRFYLEMQKADLQYWRKHHGRLGQAAYWMIILLRQLVRLPVYILMYILQSDARSDAIFKLKRALICIGWMFGLCKT